MKPNDRPATEIEITEEMIEAGARILDMDAAEEAYHSPFIARRIVEEIYRAMWRTSSPTP